MPEKKSAMDEFLGDIPVLEQQTSEDIFAKPLNEAEPEVPAKDESDAAVVKERDNREARRAKKALQAEREANIALNARLQALSETQKFAKDTGGTVDESLLRLYAGNEEAAKITQSLLNKTKNEALEEALASFRKEQEEAEQEVSQHHEELDGMLEEIEDEFNVDLTSDTAAAKKARTGFFATLEKMSPKNKSGVVTDYADALATWEMYQLSQKTETNTNRAKDLGSRSMVRSGASGEHKLEETAQERFLKEAGII